MRLIAWTILFVNVIPSMAQVKPVRTIKLSQPVEEVYVDRPGDLYLRFATGAIQKFDVDGKLITEFKPNENIALFEPRDGARAFTYSKEARWYSYAYFGNLNKIPLNEEYAIDPVLASASGDKNLWVLDQADYSLKKINTDRSTVDVEVALPEVFHHANLENLTMREYQTFLFLLYPGKGIYIFSSMGTHLKTIETDLATYFNFLGEELYFPRNGKLIFYNLFDTTTREIALEPSVKFTLLTDVRTYRIFTDRVEIFTANP
jgi:hypothetical protein